MGCVNVKIILLLVLALCILISSFFFINKHSLANKGRKHYEEAGQILWEIKTNEKIVALTFDDGPHKKYTPEVLDLLEKYNAKATFFVVGSQAHQNPEIILRMYEEGHELAIHTYTHPLKTSIPNLMEEIKQTHETIFGISGYSPTLFRPVEGQYTDAMIDAVAKEGYKVVMWSWHLDTLDWKNPGVNNIVDTVLKGVQGGNIVLFHDGGGKRDQTVKALETILPELEKQGYKFVTISELLDIQKAGNRKLEKE
jgi:peptidoglycan-N-acetylglucosamine deacetylase